MKSITCISIFIFCICPSLKSLAGDTLVFKGQASGWLNLNPSIDMPVWVGVRYIPTLKCKIELPHNKLLDFEVSANLSGNAGFHSFDSVNSDASIKPYRMWARYSPCCP